MHFSFPQKVLFKHCDPAGIVLSPRFFEMISDAVDALFNDPLGWPFHDMHPEAGVPTTAFNRRSRLPCRHGDLLQLMRELTRLGKWSLSLTTRAFRRDVLCFEADQTLVCVGSEGQPMSWPADVRARIENLMEAST